MNVYVTQSGREIIARDRETARREARELVRYSHSETTASPPAWWSETKALRLAIVAQEASSCGSK